MADTFQSNKPGTPLRAGSQGEPSAPPQGVRRYFSLLWFFAGRLILLNLLFILLCLPVVTIPCAISGLVRVAGMLSMLGHGDVARDFFSEFRAHFFAKTLVGLLLIFIQALLILGIAMAFGAAAALGAGILIVTAFFLLQCYLYAYLAMVELPMRRQLNNALYSLLTKGKQDALLLLPLLLILLSLLLPPLLLLFSFSAAAMLVMVILEDMIHTITNLGD